MVGIEADLVNAQNLKLGINDTSLANRYVMLQELEFHLGRPEAREPTTDGGIQYFYGKGDHYFDATLLLTTEEISTFNDFTVLDSDGNLPSNTFTILAENRGGGNDTTVTVTAEVPDLNIVKPVEGGVLFRMRFRITTDTVTVS